MGEKLLTSSPQRRHVRASSSERSTMQNLAFLVLFKDFSCVVVTYIGAGCGALAVFGAQFAFWQGCFGKRARDDVEEECEEVFKQ